MLRRRTTWDIYDKQIRLAMVDIYRNTIYNLVHTIWANIVNLIINYES